MAQHFGASRPSSTYYAKIRWLVGCMGCLVAVLAAAVVYLALVQEEVAVAGTADFAPEPPPAVPLREVLVSIRRIESGERLEPGLYEARALQEESVPADAVTPDRFREIVGKYAVRLLPPGATLLASDFSEMRRSSELDIPLGFRAVTISLDERELVEGYAAPDSRVDVLWRYNDPRQGMKVASIVRFSKVLSVNASRESNGKATVKGKGTTVTLLVSERDAKRIELARAMGDLSLSLVGREELGRPSNETDPVTAGDILGKPFVEEKVDPVDGMMVMSDPRTGRQMVYELSGGRWRLRRE